jgi:signal peptidase II
MKRCLPFLFLLLTVALDQGSKIAVRGHFLPDGERVWAEPTHIFGGFLWLNFHENRGVAFGLFSGLPPYLTIPIFSLVTLAAIWVIIRFYRDFPRKRTVARSSLLLIMGGAIGNLIDRIMLGRVTDFLEFAVRSEGGHRNLWPIFNVADACIVVGVAILMFLMLRDHILEKRAARTDGPLNLPESPLRGEDPEPTGPEPKG